ncbi:Probable E3 ubiquitin-protein ligase hulA [Seminavis robusta]|uniref:HECT-type E3 ubiquitin transferase n=1 Tax=Seminavis robusta TaxID=568900 RepID=A0A9N8DR83_9STRA|nr:Probable E3 ubiquitin-protein ligase hulA [Seminavis robusta]|eukprot:Sro298_g111090.1 Probable E3 ubiquitin-protein ligase hulA (766) ;mRNA; r:35966-38547
MSKPTPSTRPGAYTVQKTGQRPAQDVTVVVPHQVRPGQDFFVQLGERRVRVKCPMNSGPGQSLRLTMPAEPMFQTSYLQMAPLTAAEGPGGGGAVARQNSQSDSDKPQAYLVTIPPNVYPGNQFMVDINGQRFQLTCPPNVGPNMKVKIVPPMPASEKQRTDVSKPYTCGWDDNRALGDPAAESKTQMFEVVVPPGVSPNQSFALKANGQRVLVTCPPNVRSGQKIRFQIPVTQTMVKHIKLDYDTPAEDGSATSSVSSAMRQSQQPKTGWSRTIRVADLKFQWVRTADETSGVAATALDTQAMNKFDFQKSAYCRQLTYMEGNDPRLRTGSLQWISAKDAVVDSRVAHKGQILAHYADFAEIQRASSLEAKLNWFEGKLCQPLLLPYEEGHIKIVVRRQFLLPDSVASIMSLSRVECRKKWRLEFMGEKGMDVGGLTREWFLLLTEQLFDPAFGLWKHPHSEAQGTVSIHPNSAVTCPEDHLVYFRVLGRILGRALLDRQLIHKGGHMARFLYKHLLGFPITFDDLQDLDYEYYTSLRKLVGMGDQIEYACLDFTVTEDLLGAKTSLDLVPGGADKEVTAENVGEYLEACLRYRMMDRIQPQLTELLLGFFDVVPEPALTIFDCNELELVLCGLPTIDMADWQKFTAYEGVFRNEGPSHPVVKWFWEVVTQDFDAELQARLLQFVTGTSGVPAAGFSVLQGNDGNVRLFTLHGTDPTKKDSTHDYPKSHTCFNRLDLPSYKTKKELREKLKVSVTVAAVGFDME